MELIVKDIPRCVLTLTKQEMTLLARFVGILSTDEIEKITSDWEANDTCRLDKLAEELYTAAEVLGVVE